MISISKAGGTLKRLLQNRAVRPYLITYLVWLIFLLLLILSSTTEDGAPYPIGPGIFVAIVSAFVFSLPVWIVQFVWIQLRPKKARKISAFTPPLTVPQETEKTDTTAPDDFTDPRQAPFPQRQQRRIQSAQAIRMEEKRQRQAAAQKRIDENLARLEEAKATAAAYRESRIQATQGMDRRQLLIDAIQFSVSRMFLSEDTLKTEYPCLADEELHSLLADLQKMGVIQQRSGGNAWLSLLDQKDAQSLIESLNAEGIEDSSEPEAVRKMDGHLFEQYCAALLSRNGFTRVEVTKASGDFGIDVLAEKDGVTYAIQCKYYTDKVGNHAVQEAFSGKEYYDRMIAVVMTNSTFTPAAIETARQTHVLLWDGSVLEKMAGAQK